MSLHFVSSRLYTYYPSVYIFTFSLRLHRTRIDSNLPIVQRPWTDKYIVFERRHNTLSSLRTRGTTNIIVFHFLLEVTTHGVEHTRHTHTHTRNARNAVVIVTYDTVVEMLRKPQPATQRGESWLQEMCIITEHDPRLVHFENLVTNRARMLNH